jgi:hypothetical protein
MSKGKLSQSNDWRWHEDRQWSQSWFCKQWRGDKLHWEMEVRTENLGAGTSRLGELEMNGSHTGILTLAIHETDWDTTGD